MNNVVEIDSRQVDELLNTLSDDEFKRKLLFDAVKAGAKTLQQNTKKLFRQSMGDSATHYSKYIRKPFEEGVTVKGDKAYIEASVSIMNDFRMKFFENGTKQRTTKGRKIVGYVSSRKLKREGKGHNTGSIKPLNFFKKARENETAITDAMIKSINNALRKLNKWKTLQLVKN